MSKTVILKINDSHTIEINTETLQKDENLLKLMIKHGITGDFCGGNGMCARCKVKFLTTAPLPTAVERRLLTAEELREGYRLSCCVTITPVLGETIEIKTAFTRPDIQILDDYALLLTINEKKRNKAEADYIIADIGTTTIAMQLISAKDMTVKKTYRALNPERTFGMDVIARIQASVQGFREEIKNIIREEIKKGVRYLLDGHEVVKDIYVSANATMKQLFMGNDVSAMGTYPFIIEQTVPDVIDFNGYHLHFVPDAGTFVGGDIVSGVYALGMHVTNEVNLLVDLGTNGELVLGSAQKLMGTATAAGPAFENAKTFYVPGSDIIRIVSDMLNEHIIDSEGLLIEKYFEMGYPVDKITVTQEDIRNLQKAKAAVRCGIEALIKAYGVTAVDIAHVYLAGGFGHGLSAKSAVRIGLIPTELEDKIVSVSNTALGGAYMLGLNMQEGAWQEVCDIAERIQVINLAEDTMFNESYMNALNFPQ